MTKIKFIFFILITLLLFSCEKQEFTNLADSDIVFPSPTNLEIVHNSLSSCTLTWEDNSEVEEGFKIDRKKNNEKWDIAYLSLEANSTSIMDTEVEVGASYKYRVYGFINGNNSKALELAYEADIPTPTNMHIIVNSITSCSLDWDDNSIGEAGFKVDRKKEDGNWEEEYLVLDENIEECLDTDLDPGSTYFYRVYAFFSETNSLSVESQIELFYPICSDFNCKVISFTSCKLDWLYFGFGSEDGFKIERKLVDGNWNVIAELSLDAREYVDNGLNSDESYEYKIYPYSSGLAESTPRYIEAHLPPYTFADIDGNVYAVIQVGYQFWMTENLKVTRYRNGDSIPNLVENEDWSDTNNGAYCCYNNDNENYEADYGFLYNWYAVNDERDLAPAGWHIPTDDEIKVTEMVLGMSESEANASHNRGTNEGSKIAGQINWWRDGSLINDPEFGISSLNIVPGGRRDYAGYYSGAGYFMEDGGFWTSTYFYETTALYRSISYDSRDIYRISINKRYGLSVRCIWGE